MTEKNKIFGTPEINHTDLYNENTIWQIGNIYSELNKRYFNRTTPFPVKYPAEKHDGQIAQVKKLIDICAEHDIQFEPYIKAQFELLGVFLKTKNAKMMIFSTLLTQKAIDRYFEWHEKIENRYEKKKEQRQEIYSPGVKKIRVVFYAAMEKFIDRLMLRKSITQAVAIEELERLIRMRAISPIYVYNHPLAEKSDYLQEIALEQKKSLTNYNKSTIIKLREELSKEGLKYV